MDEMTGVSMAAMMAVWTAAVMGLLKNVWTAMLLAAMMAGRRAARRG